jgi:penicillin-binding protein 1A
MNEAYQRRPAPPDWPRPDAIITRNVDWLTGSLVGPNCADTTVATEYFIAGTEPVRECDTRTRLTLPGAMGAQAGSAGSGRMQPGSDRASPALGKRDSTRRVPDPFHIP